MSINKSNQSSNISSLNWPALRLCVLRLVMACLLSSMAQAQNGSQFKNWKPALNDGAPTRPKLDCSSLISQTGYEFSIETATLVPAAGDVPEYCLVTGQILPEVRFELSLPANWNNRFYMFGNGGYAGEVLNSPGRVNARHTALKHGFAVAQTNTGHDASNEPLGTFAVNRQKLLDYAFRAVHVTAQTSKRLIATYYNNAPSKSYFDGCSTGGRQGLMSAQRFPEDFDGIIVGAPVLNFTGTMTSYVWNDRALTAAPIPPQKLKLLSDRVYAKCDAVDGLKDGLIDDPRRCNFDAAKDLPVCAGEASADDCFTSGEIRTLSAIYGDTQSNGKLFHPGQPVSAEIAMPGPNGSQSGWANWIIAPNNRSISITFAETFFRYLAPAKPDPNYDVKSFNLDTDPAKLQTISNIVDAKNPDLSRFKARGGKIVMYFGWADTALNPLMGVNYFEQVNGRFGASTSDFFRLFMVPGMAHCRGGVGTDEFDCLTPLLEWVEKGTAPNQLAASQSRNGLIIRTRPLCPYPQVARHNGNGSIDDAKNFSCVNP